MLPPPAPDIAPNLVEVLAPAAKSLDRGRGGGHFPPMRRTFPILRWLLLPFWALQIFTGTKAFAANPILGSLALNRRGLHVWRARLAHRLAARRRKRLGRALSEAQRSGFARNGFIEAPDFLPPGAAWVKMVWIETIGSTSKLET